MTINLPVLIFGSMIGLLIGSSIHLIGGGPLIRLVFSMLFALIGFWAGNFVSLRSGISIYPFGLIDYGMSIIFSIITAILGYWLSGENSPSEG